MQRNRKLIKIARAILATDGHRREDVGQTNELCVREPAHGGPEHSSAVGPTRAARVHSRRLQPRSSGEHVDRRPVTLWTPPFPQNRDFAQVTDRSCKDGLFLPDAPSVTATPPSLSAPKRGIPGNYLTPMARLGNNPKLGDRTQKEVRRFEWQTTIGGISVNGPNVDEFTVPEKILLAADTLDKQGQSPFSAEALIVVSWQKFPKTFGLKGYADQYRFEQDPVSIMGEKGLHAEAGS